MGWDYLVDPPRGLRTATQLRKAIIAALHGQLSGFAVAVPWLAATLGW